MNTKPTGNTRAEMEPADLTGFQYERGARVLPWRPVLAVLACPVSASSAFPVMVWSQGPEWRLGKGIQKRR